MKLKVVVRRAEEGGYWAEAPAIPGCMTQGETIESLLANVREAVEGCLSVEDQPHRVSVPVSLSCECDVEDRPTAQVMKIAESEL